MTSATAGPGFADVEVLRGSEDRVYDDEREINRVALDIFHIHTPTLVLIPDFPWRHMWVPARAFQNWIVAGIFTPSVHEK